MKEKEKNKNIVLIVSESNETVRTIKASLNNKDFEFIHSKTINEALNSLTYKLPSIIISETTVNKENGFEFLKKIRKGNKTKLIPFIIISDKTSDLNENKIKAIKDGADAFLVKPLNKEELHAYITSKISHFKEFYLLSITDELTRLFNRREVLKKFINETTQNPDQVLSLALIDLDFFKQVNDVYGHQVGDEVLMVFAKILKNHLSSTFFPTRFGGEEFVILFPGLNANEAKISTDLIREEFFSHEFKSPKKKSFYVSFSAGISEYPSIGETLSILLSRADQALYSAKKDGRSRTYIFSPVMARNDRFWEYMKKSKGFYVESKSRDSITKLPFLPHVLEEIANLNFEVSCIGLIILDLKNIMKFRKYYGYKNYDYALENIKLIIEKACEKNFASEVFIGISDFFKTEFIILFPIIVNFNFNKEKFDLLANDIITFINNNIELYPFDTYYTSSIVYFNKNEPKKVVKDIGYIKNKKKPFSNKKDRLAELKTISLNNIKTQKKLTNFKIEPIINLTNGREELYFLKNDKIKDSYISFDYFLNTIISSQKNLQYFFDILKNQYLNKTKAPLLIPFTENISLETYCNLAKKNFTSEHVYITINEYFRTNTDIVQLNNLTKSLPENIKIILDNCYIGKDILNFISLTEFKYIFLSEHVTRSLHFFKEKIKIINGFKIFLDQMNIDLCVKNIIFEEELQLLQDLNVSYASGPIFYNN